MWPRPFTGKSINFDAGSYITTVSAIYAILGISANTNPSIKRLHVVQSLISSSKRKQLLVAALF